MSPKIGLIGRADARGIGSQSEQFWKHMDQPRTLVVLMGDPAWPENPGRFGRDAFFATSNLSTDLAKRGTFAERNIRKFLDGLDVVFAVETVYDWRLIDWAHDMGVKVVIQGNPEFTAHHNNPTWTHPDAWVWPTPWMGPELEELGYDLTVLPVPVETREQTAADPEDDTFRVLHAAGKAAALDRAGSLDFIEAVAGLRQRIHVTYVTQERDLPRKIRHGSNVTVDIVTGGVEDRWSLFEGQHLLVSPRKYGGLHLSVQEAMACGVPVLMPDCSPNHIWPGPRVAARKGRVFKSPFGKIQTYSTHPIDLTHQIDQLAKHRDRLADEMEQAARWADLNSWEALRPRCYDPLFEEMCS